MNKNEKDEKKFLEETIKAGNWDFRKLIKKIIIILLAGILFGSGISIGVYFVKPLILKKQKEEKPYINKVENISDEKEEKKFFSDSYLKIEEEKDDSLDENEKLKEKIFEAKKSIVEVTGFSDKLPYEENNNPRYMSGIILSETENNIYVCVSGNMGREVYLKIKFNEYDNSEGEIVGIDKDLDLTVVKIEKKGLRTYTLKNIKAALLSDKREVNLGDKVFVLGSPTGTVGSEAVGFITGTRKTKTIVDGLVEIFETDIPGNGNAGGVLFNQSGYIIGFIDGNISGNMLSAYKENDIVERIEKLLYGEKISYIGICGSDIPEKIRKKEGIPSGVYVEKLVENSPSTVSGLKKGDVIVGINDNEIKTLKDLYRNINKLKPGEKIVVWAKRNGTGGFLKDKYLVTVSERK